MNIKNKQYAQAIYEISKENNQVEDYLNLSMAILDVDLNNSELFTYLEHWDVKLEEKKKIIKDICNGIEYYENWLLILIDLGKTRNIKNFINEFIKIYNKENNIVKGYAWTTKPVNKEIINILEEKLSKKLNKKIMLENRINKEIIGGIKIEVEGKIWENTIKNKILQLLKEGSDFYE
ncbi:MAG: ATP synthase F1 subunit delta [Mycoplasmataceae bacterium]|nr:ATP synthase F1 subunit delta [Mycoplasmataceae bacterium]